MNAKRNQTIKLTITVLYLTALLLLLKYATDSKFFNQSRIWNAEELNVSKKTNRSQDINLNQLFNSNSSGVIQWESVAEMFDSGYSAVKWPVVLFETLGRLGNCLNDYATAISIQKSYPNITVGVLYHTYEKVMNLLHNDTLKLVKVFGSKIKNFKLSHEFESISSRVIIPAPDYFKGDFHSHIRPAIDEALRYPDQLHTKFILFEGYTDLLSFKSEAKYIKGIFKLNSQLKENALNYLRRVAENLNRRFDDVTFVGFHIRRTDYVHFYKQYAMLNLPDHRYYQKVLSHFRARYKNLVFIISSDDINHLQEQFSSKDLDIHIKRNGSVLEDFAVLASCNHSAMTVGSYGFWASFFTAGTKFYALPTNYASAKTFMKNVDGYQDFVGIDAN